jgi:hypothetical protein
MRRVADTEKSLADGHRYIAASWLASRTHLFGGLGEVPDEVKRSTAAPRALSRSGSASRIGRPGRVPGMCADTIVRAQGAASREGF